MGTFSTVSNDDSAAEEVQRAKLDYLEVRVRQLEQALADFVQRVENGEIRSNQTYRAFKDILAT